MSPRSRLPFESAVATGRGDDGTTGLLFGGERIAKDDPRTEAYGTVDEAVAALGLARAELARAGGADIAELDALADLVLRLQRELFVVGAELATAPGAHDRLESGRTLVTAGMVDDLGRALADLEGRVDLPRDFVVPGESPAAAALEMARTILRRAERRTVSLVRAELLPAGSQVLPYLNRAADLLWVLARAAEQAQTRTAPLATRVGPPPPMGTSRQSPEPAVTASRAEDGRHR